MAPVKELLETWTSLYSNSAPLRTAITFAHIGGLVSSAGVAVASDIAVLRATASGPSVLAREAARLHNVHRIVIVSLGIVAVSGLLLMLADFNTFVASRTFWLKMAFVAALIANGALVIAVGKRARHDDAVSLRRLRTASLTSIALWTATTFLGAMLPNVL
ncbi:MAG TPA: hypothetical protein VFJ02_20355 [Vicinamibacterales bacterium]|nr:hypothetical protein [Vicinamibacterales bacterium]